MTRSTLTTGNRTTIPKVVVEALNLRPSVQLVYEIEPDGRVLLSAKTGTFASVAAELFRKKKVGPVRALDEMDAAVRTATCRRFANCP